MSEEFQKIEQLLEAHQRRLWRLELRRATEGLATPPEVLNEIDDIRKEIAHLQTELKHVLPKPEPTMLVDLRRRALTAYFKKEWSTAVLLLTQVAYYERSDADIQTKLSEAERALRLQIDYQTICDLRDEGLWEAVIDALDDLERRQPNYPDTEGLRVWAQAQSDSVRTIRSAASQVDYDNAYNQTNLIEPNLVVSSNDILVVDSLKPEDYEYCQIEGRQETPTIGEFFGRTFRYWADAIGPKGSYMAGELSYRDGAFHSPGGPDEKCAKCQEAHNSFVAQLENNGWKLCEKLTHKWYSYRFRRRM